MVQVITYYLFSLVSSCVKCRGTNLEGLQREDREVFRQPLAHTRFLVIPLYGSTTSTSATTGEKAFKAHQLNPSLVPGHLMPHTKAD